MPSGRLRIRFVVAAGLLVLTTVTASVWTLIALSRLSGVVTATVQDSEAISAVVARLAGALEREDDAVLLTLSGDAQGTEALSRERAIVDDSLVQLLALLGPDEAHELGARLRAALAVYRGAADDLVALERERDPLVQYHLEANPELRRAVGMITTIRDRHFEAAQRAVAGARDEATAARRAVLFITLAALAIAVAIAAHLTRAIVEPLRRMTRGANAIREGRFHERIDVGSRDELGELAATINQMAEDLSEFRRTNIGEVLRAKNALEATLEALPDAVVLLDAELRIQSLNRAAVATLRAAGIESPAHLDDLRLEGLERTIVPKAIAGDLAAAPTTDLASTIRVERHGSVRRLLPRVVPVSALPPQDAGAVLLLYDVTELVRLDEMRSEFVAVASHELQTPLTTLRMTLLMLQEACDQLPQRQRELVATSLIGIEQLTETVREFLDLTRIEAGELRLELEPVDIASLTADSLRRARPRAEEKSTELVSRIEARLPPVLGDPIRLRAVLDNVLTNAIEHAPEGGTVTVSVQLVAPPSAASRRIAVHVEDTGPGVPPELRGRIFEKFFRLEHHAGGARKGRQGAGIGLYMCRQIVALHGGQITCDAGLGGRGARITIEYPAQQSASAETPAGADDLAGPAASP